MRITIDIDSQTGSAVSAVALPLEAASTASEDAGAGPDSDVPSAASAGDTRDGGPPPQWLVDEIAKASAQSDSGTGVDGLEDAGSGPLN